MLTVMIGASLSMPCWLLQRLMPQGIASSYAINNSNKQKLRGVLEHPELPLITCMVSVLNLCLAVFCTCWAKGRGSLSPLTCQPFLSLVSSPSSSLPLYPRSPSYLAAFLTPVPPIWLGFELLFPSHATAWQVCHWVARKDCGVHGV